LPDSLPLEYLSLRKKGFYAMRTRFRSFTRRRERRRTVWSHITTTSSALATAQSTDLLSGLKNTMGLSAGPMGITIRRIRLSIQIDFDLTSTVLSADSGLYCTTLLETGGLASNAVPTAASNPDKDFNFRVWIPATGGTGMPHNVITTQHIVVSREFDIKSMRKLHDIGDTLYFSAVPTGAVSAKWRIEASSLLLLP